MKLKTIHISHMCCQRCIEAVDATLNSLGLDVKNTRLGSATFIELQDVSNELISKTLLKRGFEVIVSEHDRLTEEIKIAVIELIHHSNYDDKSIKMISIFLEKKLLKPFRLLNNIFSKNTQLTIQKYAILQRIEKVKELIEEGNRNFSEIADLAGYKTPQHLSGQFKKNVGISMLEYRMNKASLRKKIDEV